METSNGRYLAGGIFERMIVNQNFLKFKIISLQYPPFRPIDKESASVQIIVWRSIGNKPVPEPMLTVAPCLNQTVKQNVAEELTLSVNQLIKKTSFVCPPEDVV